MRRLWRDKDLESIDKTIDVRTVKFEEYYFNSKGQICDLEERFIEWIDLSSPLMFGQSYLNFERYQKHSAMPVHRKSW